MWSMDRQMTPRDPELMLRLHCAARLMEGCGDSGMRPSVLDFATTGVDEGRFAADQMYCGQGRRDAFELRVRRSASPGESSVRRSLNESRE